MHALVISSKLSGPPPGPHALGDRIAQLAAELTAGEHALITAIGDFDSSGQWAKEGAYSCAQWLSWRIGMSPEASRERIRVAKALHELPAVDAAFAKARLSYSKVRALTRVATPDNEALLLDIAEASTAAQLERICRKFRGCMQASGAEAETKRRLSVRYGDDGTMRFSAQLPADEGARLLAAIESGQAALQSTGSHKAGPADATAAVCSNATAAPDQPSHVSVQAPSRVDGLMTLVESWFAQGPKPRRGGAPNEVMLHVSAETLAQQKPATPAALIDNAGGAGVAQDTALRLCCDASLTPIVQDAQGQVLDVGRKRRTVPPAIARALEAQYGRACSFPGCTHTLFLDKHHIQHWAHGGSTNLDNLVQLCRHHHTFVHEHGWTIEKTASGLNFMAPDGQRKANNPPPPEPVQDALLVLAERAAEVDEVSLRTEGWGHPVDYVQVVDALVQACSS